MKFKDVGLDFSDYYQLTPEFGEDMNPTLECNAMGDVYLTLVDSCEWHESHTRGKVTIGALNYASDLIAAHYPDLKGIHLHFTDDGDGCYQFSMHVGNLETLAEKDWGKLLSHWYETIYAPLLNITDPGSFGSMYLWSFLRS
ncbi:hypothetical protein [Corynebacterium pseudodiphtheriticum]|uniref:hypothetical protein n=1 Tax=Corynebacterium pseudodiphtheriticum TaxID=37637 RepID=UPI00254354F8|nr:hypothetical protein [Corynebacterium pseudodiphtheriticum]MDK4206969.1 hypothetical protein [Corynebacterium pseudodiphtheriticum]